MPRTPRTLRKEESRRQDERDEREARAGGMRKADGGCEMGMRKAEEEEKSRWWGEVR